MTREGEGFFNAETTDAGGEMTEEEFSAAMRHVAREFRMDSRTGVPHDHSTFVPGCFRCELGRDEAERR